MTRIPWNNKRQDLRGEVDRLLDSWVREPLEWAGRSFAGRTGWRPPLDVAEIEQAVTVWADVPGVDPEKLDVTVTGDVLLITGEKQDPTDDQELEMRFSERGHGSFRRSVQLPSAVDAAQVTAECRHGVVTIRLPKAATAPSNKITVQPS